MTLFMTDKQVDDQDALREAEDPKQVLEDANRVYNYLNRSGPLSEDELRKYGERNGLPPDRLNPALALLQANGQIIAADDHGG